MSSLATRISDLATAIGADIKNILLRTNTPSYIPASALNNWNAAESAYNFKSSNLHKPRSYIGKLIEKTGDMDVVAVFDSTGTGYNGVTPATSATFKVQNSIPYQFGKALAAMAGVPFGGGMQCCVTASGSVSSSWVLTGAATAAVSYIISSGAGTAEWTAVDLGTQVELVYSNLQTNGLTWTIDGVAQTPLVTDGTSTMRKVTVSGLQNTIHKVKVTAAAGQTMLWYMVGVRNPSIKQLYVHILALGGSRANSGTNDQNWSSTASTAPAGLGTTHVGGWNLLGYTPALVICCVGNNDLFQGQTSANTITGIQNIRNYWPNAQFSFMHPPMVPGTNATTFATFNTALFSLMDTLDANFLDWNDLVGTTTGFVADGQAGPDGIHPTWGHAEMVGRLWGGLFIGPGMPLQPYMAYRVADGGPRPNVPAGQVTFASANQPADILDGDAWEDLP